MQRGLYDLDLAELEERLRSWGFPETRARDVWRCLYVDCVRQIGEVRGLEPGLCRRLTAELPVRAPAHIASQEDPHGETAKDLVALRDRRRIEIVLLRYGERRTACISTQIGCACGCSFCATGQSGFVRNLSSGEMVGQVVHVKRRLVGAGATLSNVVLMGMGEPLLNYDHTVAAVRRMADQRGLSLPARRITLSTVGIAPAIRRLARARLGIRLAVSLHAATDELRRTLVPIGHLYPLAELIDAVREYVGLVGGRVMFEWTLVEGVNDSAEQCRLLAGLLRGIPAHVNLIRLNGTSGFDGQPSPWSAVGAFAAGLEAAGVAHTVRQSRGDSISAGCGQLRALLPSA